MILVRILQCTMEPPMIRKAIDTLSAKLSDGLSLGNSRLETLCLPVIGIASVRTVNLSHICGEMPTQARVDKHLPSIAALPKKQPFQIPVVIRANHSRTIWRGV